jgi:hypothetical protein
VATFGACTSDGVINIDPSVLSLSLQRIEKNNFGASGIAAMREALKYNKTLTRLE